MKRFRLAVLLLILMNGFLCGCGSDSSTATDLNESDNTLIAGEEINAFFGFDENGKCNYPDDYSGMWIDGENLVVAITDNSTTVKEKYLKAAGDYADCIRFVEAEFSYNYLYEACEKAVAYLYGRGYSLVEWGVSDTANKIVIGVKETKGESLSELADALTDSFAAPIMIEIKPEIEAL